MFLVLPGGLLLLLLWWLYHRSAANTTVVSVPGGASGGGGGVSSGGGISGFIASIIGPAKTSLLSQLSSAVSGVSGLYKLGSNLFGSSDSTASTSIKDGDATAFEPLQDYAPDSVNGGLDESYDPASSLATNQDVGSEAMQDLSGSGLVDFGDEVGTESSVETSLEDSSIGDDGFDFGDDGDGGD